MREEVIAYLDTLAQNPFPVSQELPFDANGTALYIKNPKRFYVDADQVSIEPFLQVFNGNDFMTETRTATAFLATDAKTPPSNYQTTMDQLQNLKLIAPDTLRNKTLLEITSEFVDDLLVTSVKLSFLSIKH